MSSSIDMEGQTFVRLTVLYRVPSISGRSYWFCKCRCGTMKDISGKRLRNGHTTSCGCLLRDVTVIRNIANATHGEAGKTVEYSTWVSMLCRCSATTRNEDWLNNYFKRGIRVCSRWTKYEHFLEDMGRRPGKGYSLERIRNNRGYYPSNCKWATAKEQANNRRPLSNHKRWHTALGINNPNCVFCQIGL